MSENSTTRANLVRALLPFDAIPVENRVRAGTPDVNFRGGWIECKKMNAWPARCEVNPVRLSHPLLDTQRIWIKRRCAVKSTELILVCLQVRREWLFFDGLTACRILEKSTRPELIENAALYLNRGLDEVRLRTWIRETLASLRKASSY